MAWIPYAIKREIVAPHDPPIKPIGIILHVDAGNAWSLFDWFSGPSKGIESHFHVRKNGEIEQYRDTEQEADANYKANSFMREGELVGFISIETQGRFSGTWTAAQLASIYRLLGDLAELHDIPLVVCPGPFEPGVGYHIMFGSPGPWTPSVKTCPGPKRIEQFRNEIVPWMERMVGETKEERPQWLPDKTLERLVKRGYLARAPEKEYHDVWRMYAIVDRVDRKLRKAIATAVAGVGAATIDKAEVVSDVMRRLGEALLGM